MPKVSIIIPVLRPQFLDACIASALAQTFTDYELLVGDDSASDDVEAVVTKWADPRVRYSRNPNRGVQGTNRDELIRRATGKYIKFLFDDDLLLPRSVEALVTVAETHDVKLVFHGHYLMNEIGRATGMSAVLSDGDIAGFQREQIFAESIRPALNLIGGPVNIMVRTDILRALPNAFGLGDEPMRFLNDMALYANLVDQGHTIVGLGERLSAFRVHAAQSSDPNSPIHAAGIFEWEYLARWAADRWPVERADCVAAIQARHEWYRESLVRYPQLERFIELGSEPDDAGRFCTAAFQQAIADCRAMIDAAGTAVSPAS